jgi:hypothetical protein
MCVITVQSTAATMPTTHASSQSMLNPRFLLSFSVALAVRR